MELFNWPVQTKPTGAHRFAVRKSPFNDGYTQRVQNGINNHWQEWSVTIDLPNPEMEQALKFLVDHKGCKRFQWKPPYGTLGTYVCEEFGESPHLDNQNVITATFTETF